MKAGPPTWRPGITGLIRISDHWEQENARLKKIIAEQALELEFKTELLKKGAQRPGKR
jgi:hypothetical protein